jgi:hypothetical protein
MLGTAPGKKEEKKLRSVAKKLQHAFIMNTLFADVK